MSTQFIYVCANCGTPVEPFFAQSYDDHGGVRCPGDDPGCSPLDDRALLSESQVRKVTGLAYDSFRRWLDEQLLEARLENAIGGAYAYEFVIAHIEGRDTHE